MRQRERFGGALFAPDHEQVEVDDPRTPALARRLAAEFALESTQRGQQFFRCRLRQQARDGVHERRLHHFTEGPRAIQRRTDDEAAARQAAECLDRAPDLRFRIGEVAAHADVSRQPANSGQRNLGRRCIHEAAGARPRPRRRRRGPRRPAPPPPPPAGRCCGAQRVGHAVAIGLRDFLHLRPPVGELARRQAHVGAQQQQVEAGAEARLLQHAQCATAARLLEPRLGREHFAHAERETLRNRDAPLRPARRAIHRIDNGADVVPLLLRLLLDDLGERPIEQQREQERGRHRFAGRHALVGVDQALAHQPRHRAIRMTLEVTRHGGQQLGQQAVTLQHHEAHRAVAGQEQLERLVEQPRRRHAA